MSTVKKHSYDIVKLYLNQLGINVFSFIIMSALIMISESIVMKICISVFTTFFFSVLIYTMAWDLGAKDKLAVDGGREKAVAYKGALLSLFANIPNFLFAGVGALLLFISAMTGNNTGLMFTGTIFYTIAKFTMMIYNGIVESICIFAKGVGPTPLPEAITAVGYFITPVISIAVTQLGYSFGLKEKKLFGSLTDSKKK